MRAGQRDRMDQILSLALLRLLAVVEVAARLVRARLVALEVAVDIVLQQEVLEHLVKEMQVEVV